MNILTCQSQQHQVLRWMMFNSRHWISPWVEFSPHTQLEIPHFEDFLKLDSLLVSSNHHVVLLPEATCIVEIAVPIITGCLLVITLVLIHSSCSMFSYILLSPIWFSFMGRVDVWGFWNHPPALDQRTIAAVVLRARWDFGTTGHCHRCNAKFEPCCGKSPLL